MNVIAYRHKKKLGWPVCREVYRPELMNVASPERTTVFTFARASVPVQELSAFDRVQQDISGDVICSFWEVTPLAAHLLWDITHQMVVGARLYLHMSENVADLLNRHYYRDAFYEEASTTDKMRVFVKSKCLPVEQDRGLNGWSFCIPTGGTDPSFLNQCVGRILSFGLEDAEVILCGTVPEGFLYPEQVRVLAEPSPEGAVHITRKKNLLVQAASYPNLCILHDRVLLPHDFMQAVTRFGDDYPFTGFQSFWFADTWRAVPRRYSDFGFASFLPFALLRKKRPGREHLADFGRMNLAAQHPERTSFGRDYLTGSLYLSKRILWQYLPQNESLYWNEYEDIEHGIRAGMAGIPSRINPYALTESQGYRSILHRFGILSGANVRGKIVEERAPMEWWGFPRRPSFTLTQQEAKQRLTLFARRYVGDDALVKRMCRQPLRGYRRYQLICQLLWQAQGDMGSLVKDWNQWILCEAATESEQQSLQGGLDTLLTNYEKKLFLLRHPTLIIQLYNNFFSMPFPDISGGNPQRRRQCIGALISAVWLKFFCRHTAFRLTVKELWRMIQTLPEEVNREGNRRKA